MKKVLIGYVLDGKHSGIDKYLLNVLEILLQEGTKVDFLTSELNEEFRERLAKKGVRLFEMPSLKHPVQQYRCVRKIIKENRYDIAYFNISEAFNCLGVLAADREKVTKIMVHSHNSSTCETNKWKKCIKILLHNLCKKIVICRKATDFYACSYKAGQWLYTEKILKSPKFSIVNNAIDVEKFSYNGSVRKRKREELGISDRIVIGHVGGFSRQKNTGFLLEIIDELRKLDDGVLLLLVGQGKEFQKVHDKMKAMSLEKYVVFLGIREDVNEIMQAMDIFVLPSLFEGLPIVAIEAQVSGLKTILSDTISHETSLSSKCIFEDIHKSAKEWATLIYSNLNYERENTEFSNSNYCFNITEQRQKILEMFL